MYTFLTIANFKFELLFFKQYIIFVYFVIFHSGKFSFKNSKFFLYSSPKLQLFAP